MAWPLAPNVSFCVASGRVILLDVARDRYFALAPEQGNAFQAWIAQDGAAEPPPIVESLRLSGLLSCRSARDKMPASPVPFAARALTVDPPISSRFASGIDAARSFMRVRGSLRRRGLLGTLERLRPTPEQGDNDETRRSAMAFMQARRPLPIAISCLPDSLAMLDFLRRRGAHASIVFGVTGTPFKAHCWVQLGDQVLNDSLDNVTPFTPILQR